MLRFDGKVAIVTGAGGGLGRAYANLLATRGASVVVNDVSADNAHRATNEILASGGTAVSDCNSVAQDAAGIVETAITQFGRLDIVVNNAGITIGGPFAEIDPVAFEEQIQTHFGGTVAVTRAAWRHLAAAGQASVINTSSSAVFGMAYTSPYSSAKAAILGLTRTLAAEGIHQNIRVNAILPNAFTPMSAKIPDDAFRDFLQRHFQPATVAGFVVWLAHPETRITGEAFSVGGGRAARVFLGESNGITVSSSDPEAWQDFANQLVRTDGFHIPVSSMDEVQFSAKCIGGATGSEASTLGLQDWGGKSG